MQNIIIITTIVMGVMASISSFIPWMYASITNRSLKTLTPRTTKSFVTKKELEGIFKKIANKDICISGKDAVERDKSDMFNLEMNTYTLFYLQLLPWMTPNRMTNTVTDVLGLELSREEKQYAYHIIKTNMEKCEMALSAGVRKSIMRTFKEVLEQIVL